ncbi:hypothetical protein M378DRAFT_91388 [Amanita muscaria Koide BX008]|uniref:DUF6589 domain-containing protein n=1 Tax=Amanita muscaria (strain Koide BX008) TaxID=946122 RepID=A0A0C2W1Y6_AMAMK|nr:hypothetical protein M378DRAFT_91388 [Amanita muscaria Koide BX008]
MEQGGVVPPTQTEEFIYEIHDNNLYIVLFHGDLGTGDRIFSIQLRRSIEKTPWNRFQYVVFVPGLFHVKMACADALHRLFILLMKSREDDTSLMGDVKILRSKQTHIFGTAPGFRKMHQVIGHSGICRRLDCWRTEVMNLDSSHTTLDLFAASKPSFDDLLSLAKTLTKQYVAGEMFPEESREPRKSRRDMQNENALMLNRYTLLYEEVSYAMNQGDIGRVELCLIPWIFIFRATGKHKYAKHMVQFLYSTHAIYPPGLKKAIRYNILVNPTGKEGKFRAVDWCVELNNLFTKAEYGGSSSNHTVDRIIKESPLVEVYRNIRTSIEQNFTLSHRTNARTDPDMSKTFDALRKHLEETKPHRKILGRKSACSIPDPMEKGRLIFQKGGTSTSSSKGVNMEETGDDEAIADVDDVIGELVE